LYYTRLAQDGQTFEPDRDLIVQAAGLDGGSGLAADEQGHVVVTWHAPGPVQPTKVAEPSMSVSPLMTATISARSNRSQILPTEYADVAVCAR
jgi:hypothetical protein